MIPRAFIDDLLARTDIVAVIDAYVPLRKAGKNYLARCPFHEEKTPSFNVNPEKQFYHCFGCGASGNVLSFLMEHGRLDFIEAVEDLASRYGLQVPQDETAKDRGPQREPLYNILNRAATYFQQQLQQHPQAALAQDYMRKRGLSDAVSAEFGLGFAPPGWDNLLKAFGGKANHDALKNAGMLAQNEQGRTYDRFRARLMFPILDQRGRTIAFGGRVLDDSTPKYLNSPETPVFEKNRELYGLYYARQQRPAVQDMIVVEGYMDVVALAQFGIRNAVATLGTAVNKEHVKTIFRSVDRVVFCFDGDEAGRKAAWKALEVSLPLLIQGKEAGFAFLPQDEDPDTLVRQEGADGLRQRFAQATGAVDFLFAQLSSEVDLNKLEGRARLIELATPLLQKMPDAPARHLLSARLQDLDTRSMERVKVVMRDAGTSQRRTFGGANRFHQTPLRTIIGLLVQEPQLAMSVSDTQLMQLAQLELAGIDLCLALLEFIQADPRIHTGNILENWRDTEHYAALVKMASWQHGLPEHGITQEFQGAVERLLILQTEQRLDVLMTKAGLGQLTAEEKAEWKQLLASRHVH